jgi:predicted Rossmann fold nucleotide-binding protein DprA/Smf involved in DNA uptake
MAISLQTQAVLLMTAWFTKPAKGDPKPLTPTEWGRFAAWLKNQEKSPEELLTSHDPETCLQGWLDPSVTPDRIRHLLGRSSALGLALEKWQRAGLWVMTRSDSDYPSRLKKRLKFEAPPILFGCGNRRLLDQSGIAVVGSRDAAEEEIGYTSWLGAEIASQGFSVISGGARGVDEAAMLSALGRGGTVVGVLADSLLRAVTSQKYRDALMKNDLVLVSSFNPEAGFDVGNAMRRNRYVYCLADAAVVVTTSKEKGGTWNGAIENLKHRWVPLWVKEHLDPDSGSAALVQQGARWLPASELSVNSLASQDPSPGITKPAPPANTNEEKPEEPPSALDHLSFYELFVQRLEASTSNGPATLEDLLQQIDVSEAQMKQWLKRAEAEGRVSAQKKPLRYKAGKTFQQRLDL